MRRALLAQAIGAPLGVQGPSASPRCAQDDQIFVVPASCEGPTPERESHVFREPGSQRMGHAGFASTLIFLFSSVLCPLWSWKLVGGPAAAEGLDKLCAGDELPGCNVGLRALVGQQRGLRGEHFEIVHQALFVAAGTDLE